MGGGLASLRTSRTSIRPMGVAPAAGYYGRVGLGVRVHATRLFAFGGGLSYELMALTPSGVGGGDLRTIADEIVNGRAPQAWSDARKMAGSGLRNGAHDLGQRGPPILKTSGHVTPSPAPAVCSRAWRSSSPSKRSSPSRPSRGPTIR